jgi:hypothetical protein
MRRFDIVLLHLDDIGNGYGYDDRMRGDATRVAATYKRAEKPTRISTAQSPSPSHTQHITTLPNYYIYFLDFSRLHFNMQLSTLFTIFASAIAVQAGCYSGGDTWAPDQVQANNLLDELCNGLSGDFAGGQTKYGCRDAGSANKKFEFWVQNTPSNSASLGHGDCVLRLSNEINGCQNGGDTTTAGWNFR